MLVISEPSLETKKPDLYQSDTAENKENSSALPVELSNQLGLVASLIQFKSTKYFHESSFYVSGHGSEIELKHCAYSKTSVKSSRKYSVHLNWIRLATNR